MSIHRRGFLMGAATTAVGLTASLPMRRASGAPPQPAAVLRLSSQIGLIPGKEIAEKLAKMEQWGFEGVELPRDVVTKAEQYQKALANTPIKPSAVCYGSLEGGLVSEVVERRARAEEELRRALTIAGELKSTGVIYVPAFNGQTKLTNQEIRQILVDRLPAIGEHAVKAGTRLLLEPLNRKEAFFLRQLADAAAICRDCNSPGIAMMGDFYHMAIEETSAMGAFLSAGAYLHHVHLASKTRVLPGQDRQEDEPRYLDGFQGLKWIGYQGYCSFECGCRGNKEVEFPRSMAFLREMWGRASSPR